MKIKFNTDDNIPLNKIIYIPTYNNKIYFPNNKICNTKYGKYYPQPFLDECLFEV